LPESETKDVFIIRSEATQAENFARSGASGVKVQQLVGEPQGSKRVTLRLYTVGKGGHTNLDQHEYEHQMYVLKGHGTLRGKGGDTPLHPGDAVFLPANTLHQFINDHDDPLVYLLSNIM
jgi:quercetin dioxygenase-like cupin family protein